MGLSVRLFGLVCASLSIVACGGGGGSGSSDACGPFRIFNGEVCEDPSSAVVRLNTGRSLCTGTFVAADRVLTAAHCIDRAGQGLEIIAATGASVYLPPNQLYFMRAWQATRDSAFDVAVLLVPPGFAAQNGILPIQVSSDLETSSLVGDEIIVAGLGDLGGGVPNSSPFPRSTFMEITNLENGVFVAADTESERTGNACVGDSGAPALYRQPTGEFVVIGVVSRGAFSNDCRADPFTVFPFLGNGAVGEFLSEFGLQVF